MTQDNKSLILAEKPSVAREYVVRQYGKTVFRNSYFGLEKIKIKAPENQ